MKAIYLRWRYVIAIGLRYGIDILLTKAVKEYL